MTFGDDDSEKTIIQQPPIPRPPEPPPRTRWYDWRRWRNVDIGLDRDIATLLLVIVLLVAALFIGWRYRGPIYKSMAHVETKPIVPPKPTVFAPVLPAPQATTPVVTNTAVSVTELGRLKGAVDLLQQSDRTQNALLGSQSKSIAAVEQRTAVLEATTNAHTTQISSLRVDIDRNAHAIANLPPAPAAVSKPLRARHTTASRSTYQGGIPKPHINSDRIYVYIKKKKGG